MAVVIGNDYAGTIEPLYTPRICYEAYAASIGASTTAAGTSRDWLKDGETWSVWQATSTTAQINLVFSEALTVDYIAIAAHNLGATGAAVRPAFQASSGGSYAVAADLPSHSPNEDSAIVWLFEPRVVWGVQLQITGGSAAPAIAVYQSGQSWEFPRASVFTGLPISESDQIRYRQRTSLNGDILGRAVEGAGLQFSVEINNLAETFRASAKWQAFREHIKNSGSFFIAPKPLSYPSDVAYAQLTDQPRFERTKPNKLLSGSLNFNCVGYKAP